MGEVVYVNFKHRCRTIVQADKLYFGFVELLRRMELDEDDIADVLDGIKDVRYYQTLDDDLKRIVDVWHNCTVNL